MRLAKKSILYFVAELGTSLVGFLATLYFARILGAGPLGQYFLVVALVGWLKIPSNGIASAINKRVSEGGEDSDLLSTGVLLGMAYGGVVAVAVFLAGQFVDDYVGAEVSILVALLLFITIVFNTVEQGLLGQKKVATAGILRTGDRIARVVTQVALVTAGYTVVALVGGHAFAAIASAFVGLVIFRFRPKMPDKERIRSILDYGRYSWLGNMKSKTFGWMDTLVLGLFVSSGLIGIYEVSWRLASILILVSNAVENTLFPEISDVATDGKHDEIQDLLSEALFYAGIFVIPGLFGTLALGERILRIYGPEFVKGAPILVLLVFARTVNVYEMQFLNVINGIDRPDVAFRINVVFIATNVGLNMLLVWQFGWVGAAVATIVSSAVILLLSYQAIDDLIGAPTLPLGGIGQQILAATAMAATVLVTQELLPVQNMYVTVGLVCFGAAVYGAVLFGLSARVRTKVRSLAAA